MLKRKQPKVIRNGHPHKSMAFKDESVAYTTSRDSRKVVSLFTGAMGLDLGLVESGLQIAVAQDFNSWCMETIRLNSTHSVVPGDIKQLIEKDPSCSFLLKAAGIAANEVFAVVGGPPCQAYSHSTN